MRHRHSRLRLRHKPAHSRSIVRNIVTSTLLYESIRTTKKRAEVARPLIERIMTIAKTKTPQLAVRTINRIVTHKNASRKVMEVFRERFAGRPSGFTRIEPVGSRRGDGAKLVTLSLVEGIPVARKGADVTDVKKKRRHATSVTSDTSVPSVTS